MAPARSELLREVDRPTVRRERLGIALDVASHLVVVVWTLLLADTVQHAFSGTGTTGWRLALLAALVALRAGMRMVAVSLLASASDDVRHARRRALVAGLVDATRHGRRAATGEDGTLLGPGVDALDDYVTRYRPARSTASVVPVVVLVVVAVLDPVSMAILLFTGPMLLALLALVGSRTRALADRRLAELGWLRSFHLDMVRGIPTLRVFGRAREGARTIGEVSDRFGATTMDVLRTAFQTSLVIEWAATAATALVAVQVGLRVVERSMGFAPALAVLLLTPEFFSPFRTLAVEYHAGRSGEAALERLRAAAGGGDERATPHRAARPTPPGPTTSPALERPPAIAIDTVTVRAPDDGRVLLERATMHVEAGATVALVGPSGIGKSTVARMVLALHRPELGCVRVDDTPLDRLDPDEWRRSTTFVTQRPMMPTGTVAEAIALSRPRATRSEIEHALWIAGGDQFVGELPDGLDTSIGEGGMRLSGGQRQRLAIARAVLRPAPVVVLDEFTAHLDPATERLVIDRIAPFLADRTVLLLAHREATLALADRVVALEDRRFTEVVG